MAGRRGVLLPASPRPETALDQQEQRFREAGACPARAPEQPRNGPPGACLRLPPSVPSTPLLGASCEPTARPEPASLDEHIDRLLDLEAAAHHIHGWHPTLMPGMLQTADYARAAIRASAPALPPYDVEKRATGRTVRIDTLGRAAGRTARFVIGEAVLRQPVGGPATHAAQLDHLMTLLALRPTLDVRVLPQGEAHPGLYGPFTVYQGAPGAPCSSSTWPEPRSSTPRKEPYRSSTPTTMWERRRRARWTRFE